jgi:phosphoenolpyruvate-protein kinase (PTS system EI component)
MFRQQLRAILRASAFGKVRILIPMVAHLSEVRQTSRRWRGPASNWTMRAKPMATSRSAP